MCPVTVEQPVLGTLKLVYVGSDGGIHSYAVEDVNWYLLFSNGPTRIVGSGRYRIGSPDPTTVIQHRLELDMRVGADPVAHFDSGWSPLTDSGIIALTVSMNGMYCWDRVVRVHAHPIEPEDQFRLTLDPGSTFQRGCIDGVCDCAVGPQQPMQGQMALVPLDNNTLFQTFAVVNVRWRTMSANAADGIPLVGFGLYWVGGEVAVQNRLLLEVRVANEDFGQYDSGLVGGGGQFPHIDIVTRTHTHCVDTLLHVIASPADGGGELCGGFAGIPCNDGEFCKLLPGHCCCDFQGTCTTLPQACPEYYDPVCGCDGVTYANECFADMGGQSIDYWGPCRTLCGPNGAPCKPGEFCKFPTGSCGAAGDAGLCTATTGACPDVWDPVCGCNGITYGNECEADAAGVSVRHLGICDDPCRPTPDGFGCTSCFSDVPEDVCRATLLHLDIHGGAITTLDCDCMNFSACHIEFGNASPFTVGNCPPDQTCEVIRRDSDNDGIDDTFWAQCMSSLEGPCCLDIDDGPVRYDTCLPRTEAQCNAEGGVFAGTNAGCDATQACCFANSNLCVQLHSTCCLASGGVPQGPGSACDATAACTQVCGGIAGIPCDHPDEFCKLPVGQCCCDQFGVCTLTGGSCPAVWDPVCGCDGVTYSSECEADSAGVSISHLGPCSPPTCAATRVLDNSLLGHCTGFPVNVRLELAPPANAIVIAIEDSPPPGWGVSAISDGGVYDPVNHKVKWGPLFPPFPLAVSYLATPLSDTTQPACFHGTISLNGINEPICGEGCLEPCCPPMQADLPHEGCPMCPVTDCNSCDASMCGDGRVHMCEVVGYACSWLHGCHDDLAGMTRAAYIWRTGECYCWDGGSANWQAVECSGSNSAGCCPNQHRMLEMQESSATVALSRTRTPTSGSSITRKVWVDLEVAPEASAVALEISVPAGWKVKEISDGGVWDGNSRTVRWGVFFEDLSRTVGFTVVGSVKAGSGRGDLSNETYATRWSGWLSVDGQNYRIRPH